MKFSKASGWPLTWCILCAGLFAFLGAATAGEAKIDARLLWAVQTPPTNSASLKLMSDQDIIQKLSHYRWTFYYEMMRTNLLVGDVTQNVTLSSNCVIGIKQITPNHFEFAVIGKGVPVVRMIQKLPKNDAVVFSGAGPESESAWVVVLKRRE